MRRVANSMMSAALLLAATALGCRTLTESDTDPAARQIELSVLEDKIRGGWAGQMIGVTYGAPTEFQYLERLVPEEDIPAWSSGEGARCAQPG